MSHDSSTMSMEQLLSHWPFVEQYLADNGFQDIADRPEEMVATLLDQTQLEALGEFIAVMEDFLGTNEEAVREITIIGGKAKDGTDEPVQELTIKVGEIICIVGPTGSGKSRLLGDIEWVAKGDTPTSRHIKINGGLPGDHWRFSTEHKLVAQISQNMNFVMDLSVEEFLQLHAESRQVDNAPEKIQKIWNWANELAGEPFALDTPVTSLSGGQSRALMIADTAVLSNSPVVLIDEIENAGIDRQQALDILIRQEKIVLMATHDPILALMGDKRIIINNGAMQKVIEPSEKERENLTELRVLDARLMNLRHRLRMGDRLDEI